MQEFDCLNFLFHSQIFLEMCVNIYSTAQQTVLLKEFDCNCVNMLMSLCNQHPSKNIGLLT